MEKISSQTAPKAIWAYSQAIKIWNTLYSSGQIALDPKSMELVTWWVINQTDRVCKNLWEVLKEAWFSYQDVVKTSIFLKNMKEFKQVNSVYEKYFSHKPARSTLQVASLPIWALIEIELIAIKDEK